MIVKMRRAGTWDHLLQCLHLNKRLLEQQTTKKLEETKNNCGHVQLGHILDNTIQKDQRPQLPLLKGLEQKQGTAHAPCTEHHQRAGRTP